MKIAVQVEPGVSVSTDVEYLWDADTEILSARLSPCTGVDGMSGSVGLEGSDGSWVVLDVKAGTISGVEVAVWPDVRTAAALAPPDRVEDARVVVPARQSQPNIASIEMATRLLAESDHAQRTFHFRLGNARRERTLRLARDLLLEVDDKSHISGLWLLNVPPCPPEP